MPTLDSTSLKTHSFGGSTYYYGGVKLSEDEWAEVTDTDWLERTPFTSSVQLTSESDYIGTILYLNLAGFNEEDYPEVSERWYDQMYNDTTAQREVYEYRTSSSPEVTANTMMVEGIQQPIEMNPVYVRLVDFETHPRELIVQPINSTARIKIDRKSLYNIYRCTDTSLAERYDLTDQLVSAIL